MTIFDNYEVWFVIGSQHLYGPETLRQVTQHAEHVVNALNTEAKLPCKLVLKPLGTTPDEITAICRDANYDDRCAGLVVWLHTFSPAKMWINGLTMLNKPLLQFHTQFNAALPWDSIDMDFMNLHMAVASSASLARVCVSNMPWLPVTGRINKPMSVSAPGCARRSLNRIPVI